MTLTQSDLQAIALLLDERLEVKLEEKLEQKLEEKLAPIHERLDRIEERLDQVEERLDRVEERLDQVEERLDRVEERLDRVEERLDRVEGRFDHMNEQFNQMKERLDSLEANIGVMGVRLDGLNSCIEEVVLPQLVKIMFKLDHAVIPQVKNIEGCYLSTFQRDKEASDKMSALDEDVHVLKKIAYEHSRRIHMLEKKS